MCGGINEERVEKRGLVVTGKREAMRLSWFGFNRFAES